MGAMVILCYWQGMMFFNEEGGQFMTVLGGSGTDIVNV